MTWRAARRGGDVCQAPKPALAGVRRLAQGLINISTPATIVMSCGSGPAACVAGLGGVPPFQGMFTYSTCFSSIQGEPCSALRLLAAKAYIRLGGNPRYQGPSCNCEGVQGSKERTGPISTAAFFSPALARSHVR